MPENGIIIAIPENGKLPLYLRNGVYGGKMSLGIDGDPQPETYVQSLIKYASCREDDHVFFYSRGRFVYGGRIIGSSDRGSFYLNGAKGVLGKRADAPLVWEGPALSGKEPSSVDAHDRSTRTAVCRPFLIRFRDWLQLQGNWIEEDAFYYSLRDYNYKLPTIWWPDNMFSVSPGETEILLNLLIRESDGQVTTGGSSVSPFHKEPTLYDPAYGLDLETVITRDELMATILSDPAQVPPAIRPDGAAVGYRVPVSPHRPRYVETADIAYYSARWIKDGTLPDLLLYIDVEAADEEMRERIERQRHWLKILLGTDVDELTFIAAAPYFDRGFYGPTKGRANQWLNEIVIGANCAD